MWKLLVLAAFVCLTSAQQGGGDGPLQFLEHNLTAVWEHLHEIEAGSSCSPQITMRVHGPHGRPGHHSASHEDDEEHDDGDHGHDDHGHDDHDGSGEHGHPGRRQDGAHVHVHLHMGPRDIYHANPLPWADRIPKEYTHALCHMHAGDHDISGDVHLRQRFVGHDDVEMDFDLSGFDAGVHDHTFMVHRYGNFADGCSHLGAVFTPPHRHMGHGPHSGSHEDHNDDHHDDHHDHPNELDVHARRRRSPGHHGHHSGERGDEGVLGALSSDENGEMHGVHEFRTVTLVGAHRIVGRSLAIHQGDDADGTGPPLACCVISMTDGSHWGDTEGDWLPGEHGDHH